MPGTYDITLFAYNQLGCADSTQQSVSVFEPETFFIPNSFSPNGDGNNDFFGIQTKGNVQIFDFQIFNRLGEKVHENLFPWDGYYKGKPAPPGVYVYVFKLGLTGDDTWLIRKGSVTLLK
jgi:gliding motility-associated-like protein